MKYTRAAVIVALAVAFVAGAYLLWRPDATPVAASPWIIKAAIALNRASAHGTAQGGAGIPAGDQSAARQLALEGQQLRVQRRFAEAEAVYREVVKADPMDADAWADLADSAAAAAGNDLTKGRDAILRAITIDPKHRKALWLRASLELQEQRYTEAAATWRQLEALVTPGSTDARVIAANIVEADVLARGASIPDWQGS